MKYPQPAAFAGVHVPLTPSRVQVCEETIDVKRPRNPKTKAKENVIRCIAVMAIFAYIFRQPLEEVVTSVV